MGKSEVSLERTYRSMLYKIIFDIGKRLRNPSIDRWFAFLKESEKWDIETLEKYQLQRLQEIVSFAYEHSEFYRKTFDEAKVHPSHIQSLSDVTKLPILEKKDVIACNAQIHTKFKFKKVHVATTSGSTGDSLVFNRDESADSFNRAAIFRGYSWHGVEPWQRNGYFWGFDFTAFERIKVWFLDRLQNRFRVFNYQDREFKRFARKLLKAQYIHGYSSMIYQSAKLINQWNLPKPKNIKMVKGTSEKIYDSYHEEVIKAFGHKVISEYGATEPGIMAFECPEGNMHMNMEGVLIEKIDNEIIVTNLQMKSFPVIRYRLGDYIELAPKTKQCACGRAHYIVEEVTGRIGENVYGNKQVYPSLYFYYIFKNLGKKHNLKLTYQVVQETKGRLTFNIEEKLNQDQKQLLENEIVNYFSDDIAYTITDGFKKEKVNSKSKSFISYI